MDFIDHIIYTANTANVRGTYPPVLSDFASITTLEPGTPGRNETTPASPVPLPSIPYTDSYDRLIRDRFIYYEDPIVIERAIQKHWYDINNGPINLISASVNLRPFDVNDPPPYHLIYAYLMENTRIAQIMERLIYLYQQDEVLGVASPTNDDHRKAMQWIMNTENLFYKTLSNTSYRNITGNLRPNPESSRRNAYFRMFGIDLAFDNTNILDGGVIPYYKAKSANKEFIPLVEQFLAELWQGYINAQNTSGANSTDYQRIIDMAVKIRQMLMSRRGASGTILLKNYRFMNLSKEEYASVGFLTWLFSVISYDSPLVNFLGCQGNTAAERLSNIGKKVGVEAHKKAHALFDMAGAMATILRNIEFGTFEIIAPDVWIRLVIESQTQDGSTRADQAQKNALIDILTVINNWEKATGHKIKNRESNIAGVVRIAQQARGNGVSVN